MFGFIYFVSKARLEAGFLRRQKVVRRSDDRPQNLWLRARVSREGFSRYPVPGAKELMLKEAVEASF